MTTTLPTDDLKKYGIIDADNSFSKKLSAEDIKTFYRELPLSLIMIKAG